MKNALLLTVFVTAILVGFRPVVATANGGDCHEELPHSNSPERGHLLLAALQRNFIEQIEVERPNRPAYVLKMIKIPQDIQMILPNPSKVREVLVETTESATIKIMKEQIEWPEKGHIHPRSTIFYKFGHEAQAFFGFSIITGNEIPAIVIRPEGFSQVLLGGTWIKTKKLNGLDPSTIKSISFICDQTIPFEDQTSEPLPPIKITYKLSPSPGAK